MPRQYVQRSPRPPYRRVKPHNAVTSTQIRLLRQLLSEGTAKTEIAASLGLSRRTVYRLIERYCTEE